MANWCYNLVNFEGEGSKLKALKKLFQDLAMKEEKEKCGQLPPFIQLDKGYMFSINWDSELLSYDTKWSPNVEVIQIVADLFGVNFKHSYTELGNLIYGEYTYHQKQLSDIFLESADFDLFEQKEGDEDTWLFEGEEYDDEYEILEILLNRKKQNIKL